jgi:catechol 2,3-dioxygenase-like lactoylglutathione lyase family enzyme
MVEYQGIALLVARVPSPDAAAALFEKLGLRVAPLVRMQEQAIGYRLMPVGGPDNLVALELLGDAGVQDGAGLSLVVLRVKGLDQAVAELKGRGVRATLQSFTDGDGNRVADVAVLDIREKAVVPLALIEFTQAEGDRHRELSPHGLAGHALPLQRLDHLAAFTADLESTTAYWTETLGIPRWGEVRTPAMLINQMRVGDAIIELLGPSSPESPMASRPPGFISMAAFEVPDVEAAVAHARTAGFTLNDAGPGALPGTKVTTIAGPQLGGIALQLLQRA